MIAPIPSLVIAAAFLTMGCDQGQATSWDAGNADATTDLVPGDPPDLDGCSRELTDLEVTSQAALYGEIEEQGFWIVESVIEGYVAFPPVSLAQLEIWTDRGGPIEPGTYGVDPGDYARCGLCLLVREDCVPVDGIASCQRDFLAWSGSVELVDLEASGGNVSGVVRDAVLVESWIDWDSGTFESFPLDGGEVICIDRLEFGSLVSAYPSR
jgi:hypothetical protein